MSTKENKSREEIKAAREAKKLAKQKGKVKTGEPTPKAPVDETKAPIVNQTTAPVRCEDEVDRAFIRKKETAAPFEKDGKGKKGDGEGAVSKDITVKDVVETLKEIADVAKEVQSVTAKVSAISIQSKPPEESGKSKADLRTERRLKQEAQRAAKEAAQKQAKLKTEEKAKPSPSPDKYSKEVKSPKTKTLDRVKTKQTLRRVTWFQHLYNEQDKEVLKKIPLNSNLHPAIVKLGAQLAARVVTGANARCLALLDALKKMIKDYTLPAKTEFARGLESHLSASLQFLWTMRAPSASQANAVQCLRYHLTQLSNNVDEHEAKTILQEEIDRYIREQIDMAGVAISIAVRNKIANGDNILTYGCSSLIERILTEAHGCSLRFHTYVVGERVQGHGREMFRRLCAKGLPCSYADITALSYLMKNINLVLLGASALLRDGSVLCASGAALAALAARAHNVPVLVPCETHKFSERVLTSPLVFSELGDPDDLIDPADDNSPLKDWRSNPNLTPLHLTYDVIPPRLVTAVVTELAILPCTSAPVVLRFKLSEYGM